MIDAAKFHTDIRRISESVADLIADPSEDKIRTIETFCALLIRDVRSSAIARKPINRERTITSREKAGSE